MGDPRGVLNSWHQVEGLACAPWDTELLQGWGYAGVEILLCGVFLHSVNIAAMPKPMLAASITQTTGSAVAPMAEVAGNPLTDGTGHLQRLRIRIGMVLLEICQVLVTAPCIFLANALRSPSMILPSALPPVYLYRRRFSGLDFR